MDERNNILKFAQNESNENDSMILYRIYDATFEDLPYRVEYTGGKYVVYLKHADSHPYCLFKDYEGSEGDEYFESLDFTHFDFSNLGNWSNMFSGCKHLKHINFSDCFSNYNDEGQTFNAMFHNCKELEYVDMYNVSGKKVIGSDDMFNHCDKLKYVILPGDTNYTETINMYYGVSGMFDTDNKNLTVATDDEFISSIFKHYINIVPCPYKKVDKNNRIFH